VDFAPLFLKVDIYMSDSLIYNAHNGQTNLLLIDSDVKESQLFFDSCNSDTFPVIYSKDGTTETIKEILTNFQQINRIGFVFHDPGNSIKPFINNTVFFSTEDVTDMTDIINKRLAIIENVVQPPETKQYSTNFVFLTDLIKQFHVTNVDFLACNLLQHSSWKTYFDLLSKETNVIVGASNDETGNVVGSDWILESTKENIKPLYFTSDINNYTGKLAITLNVTGTLYFKQEPLTTGPISYSLDNTNWTEISWPVTIINTDSQNTTLTCYLTTNLNLTSASQYFIVGSDKITFDGQYNTNYTVNINGVSNYLGLIQNGTTGGSYGDITIQNIGVTTTNNSGLNYEGGWLCQPYFGRTLGNGKTIRVTNCYSNGSINNVYAGGIFGSNSGFSMNGGTISVTNCYSTGSIGTGAGGIFGGYSGLSMNGTISATNCYSTGSIGTDAGGIFGGGGGYFMSGGTISATNCYSTENISGRGGGIFGRYCGNRMTGGTISATHCYSTGSINSGGGGIFGSNCGNLTNNIPVRETYVSSNSPSYGPNSNVTVIQPIFTNSQSGWFNTDANAVLLYYTSGPNKVWTTGVTITTPYLLTSFLPPTITSVSPISGSINGGTTVTIEGTNFTGAPTVQFGTGNFATNVTVVSDTQITCTSPPGSAGTVDITITTTGGVVTSTNAFTYAVISYTPTNAGRGYSFTLTYTGLTTISNNEYTLKNGATQLSTFIGNGGTTYTFNNVTLTTAGPNTLTITNTSVSPNVIIDNNVGVTVEVICFLEGSKILTDKGYVPIQTLKKGDLVKTLLHGYKPIYLIGKRDMKHVATNERIKDQLYTCSKNKFEELFEDLVITGCHSLLVDNFTNEEQRERTKQLLGANYVTDRKYRLPACLDKRTTVYKPPGTYTIYHLALEHDNYYMNYGIYANGLLVETCSKRYLKELSGMFHL